MAIDQTILNVKSYYNSIALVIDTIGKMDKDPNYYSDEHRRNSKKQLIAELEKNRINTINKIKPIFQERINEAKKKQEFTYNDSAHHLMVANAIKLLELLGDNISVNEVNNILAPIRERGDFPTLQVIRGIVQSNHKLSMLEFAKIDFGPNLQAEVAKHEQMQKFCMDSLIPETATNFGSSARLGFAVGIKLFAPELGYMDKNDVF